MNGYYLGDMGQVLDMVSLGLKAATIAAPSIESMFGGGGAGNQVDPMGAQRQQTFQQEELEEAQAQTAQVQQAQVAVANAATAQQKSSSLTDWLIFGGVGLVLFGTVGLLLYRHERSDL